MSTVEEQEVCHQYNRRTEFKVIREDFVSKKQNTTLPQNLPTPSSNEEDNQDNE